MQRTTASTLSSLLALFATFALAAGCGNSSSGSSDNSPIVIPSSMTVDTVSLSGGVPDVVGLRRVTLDGIDATVSGTVWSASVPMPATTRTYTMIFLVDGIQVSKRSLTITRQ